MSKNFLDIASLFSDNPQHTWSNGIQSSRIDQIWISPSLSLTPISFKTIDITPFYNADHKLIICSFEISNLTSQPTTHSIKTNTFSPHATPHRPLINTSLFKQHRKITHLLSSLHSFKQSTPLPIKWHTTFCSIKTIASLHNYTFPKRDFINKQITENIKKRCNNMKDNLSSMLSSILEKPYRCIDLNKILITLPDGSQHISSDPDTVKSHTRIHFSNISSTANNPPPNNLWNEWAHVYQPLNYIKPEWYDSILSPITKTELLNNI
ncbi:3874_t:CDS:2 [Entrophospora sp. SA101]|nr:3874_t:CDS:2 [Entrophospora sp. SA101]